MYYITHTFTKKGRRIQCDTFAKVESIIERMRVSFSGEVYNPLNQDIIDSEGYQTVLWLSVFNQEVLVYVETEAHYKRGL